jgi:hypothetical protein
VPEPGETDQDFFTQKRGADGNARQGDGAGSSSATMSGSSANTQPGWLAVHLEVRADPSKPRWAGVANANLQAAITHLQLLAGEDTVVLVGVGPEEEPEEN